MNALSHQRPARILISPQSPGSESSQSDTPRAVTGNRSNTPLTSCAAQIDPSATTTFSPFAAAASIVTIDDPGTLCVKVSDTAAPTAALHDRMHRVDGNDES